MVPESDPPVALRAMGPDERLGWRPTDVTTRSTYPPHAQLRRYERDLLES